jgi:hypothetical protein
LSKIWYCIVVIRTVYFGKVNSKSVSARRSSQRCSILYAYMWGVEQKSLKSALSIAQTTQSNYHIDVLSKTDTDVYKWSYLDQKCSDFAQIKTNLSFKQLIIGDMIFVAIQYFFDSYRIVSHPQWTHFHVERQCQETIQCHESSWYRYHCKKPDCMSWNESYGSW